MKGWIILIKKFDLGNKMRTLCVIVKARLRMIWIYTNLEVVMVLKTRPNRSVQLGTDA